MKPEVRAIIDAFNDTVQEQDDPFGQVYFDEDDTHICIDTYFEKQALVERLEKVVEDIKSGNEVEHAKQT